MENFLKFKQIRDPRRFRFASMKLKSHASLWWDNLQLNRKSCGTEKIKILDRMVSELKNEFLPIDYALNMLRRL